MATGARGSLKLWLGARPGGLFCLAALLAVGVLGGCTPQAAPMGWTGSQTGSQPRSQPVSGGCTLSEITAVRADIAPDDHGVIVAATIDGQDTAILLSTGPTASVIYDSLAKRLGLKLQMPRGEGTLSDARLVARDTVIDSLQIGNLTMGHFHALVPVPGDGKLRDTTSDAVSQQTQVGGMVGPIFLSSYDVEFDLAAHRVVLFAPNGCSGPLRPWNGIVLSANFGKVAASTDGHENAAGEKPLFAGVPIDLEATVNGVPGTVVLESIRSGNKMSPLVAKQIGLVRGSPGVKDLGPIGGGHNRYQAIIQTVVIGDETLRNVPVTIDGGADWDHYPRQITLGVEFFKANRIYVDYRHRVLYFAPYAFLDARH